MCIFQMDMSFIFGGITHVIVRPLVIYVFDVLVHGGGGGVIGGLRYVKHFVLVIVISVGRRLDW